MPTVRPIRGGLVRSSLSVPRSGSTFGALVCSAACCRAAHFKVEPPNWWTGFHPGVMVLLYGENLTGADIKVTYPGVSVAKVADSTRWQTCIRLAEHSEIATRPGDVVIRVKTVSGGTQAILPLLLRSSPQGKFQGVTRDDVIYLIMPDRFADGDPSNNMPPGAAAGTYDRSGGQDLSRWRLEGRRRSTCRT